MRMSWGANIPNFFYDESGLPYAMKYNGTVYYYITNLQGDVMRIVDTINFSDPVANHIHGVGIFNKNGGGYFEAVMDYLLNHAEESLLNLISW